MAQSYGNPSIVSADRQLDHVISGIVNCRVPGQPRRFDLVSDLHAENLDRDIDRARAG
jgi:hypothetical protein